MDFPNYGSEPILSRGSCGDGFKQDTCCGAKTFTFACTIDNFVICGDGTKVSRTWDVEKRFASGKEAYMTTTMVESDE